MCRAPLHRFHDLRLPRALGLVACLATGCDGGAGLQIPALEVRTSTTGTEPDPDGYSVAAEGADPLPIGPVDTIIVESVEPGRREVTLGGIAANCAVAGDNPATATIVDGATAVVTFEIVCGASTGTLEVTTTTAGAGADPDGYTVSVDDAEPVPIEPNGAVSVTALAPGAHLVTLAGLSPRCAVEGDNPRAAEVPSGGTATIAFSVQCASPDPGRIAFTSNAPGLLGVFVVNPDGSGLAGLTPDGTFEFDPVWSPDGSRLLMADALHLYVMNADGTGRARLVEGEGVFEYRWSPDGSRIAYAALRPEGGSVLSDVRVMAADGSGKRDLARDAATPTWSPDGRQIAYVSFARQPHIRIVEVSGDGDRRLTDPSIDAFQPAWSPDGGRIAFATLAPAREIRVIATDGTDEVNLTAGQGLDESPVWSPDGSRLAFVTGTEDDPLSSEIAVTDRDGGNRRNLTDRPGFDFSPDWSPDGERITFVRSEEVDGGLDSEIYVMPADGGQEVNVTERPESYETAPDWSGSRVTSVTGRMSRVGSALERLGVLARLTP